MPGDIITKINGRDMIAENNDLWYDLTNSQSIKLTILRKNVEQQVVIKKQAIIISNN